MSVFTGAVFLVLLVAGIAGSITVTLMSNKKKMRRPANTSPPGRPSANRYRNDPPSDPPADGSSSCEQCKQKVRMATELKTRQKIYKMSRHPRGKCVILNNHKFPNVDIEPREGSEYDVQRVKELFRKLYFDVVIWENKTKLEITKLLKELSQDKCHKDADCFVLILMSHGNENDIIYDVEKEEISIRSVIEMFSNENCWMLCGKPKLFFIQACRGCQHDSGIPVPTTTDNVRRPAANKKASEFLPSYVPHWTDMYVAYATAPGYVSHRHPNTGSWFMDTICDVFSSRARYEHLEDMMRIVTDRLTSRDSYDGGKQAPEYRLLGWNKQLYFNLH